MIRLILSILFGGLLFTIVHAQQTAMWEMTVYVEDAVGNRDSVVIGVDTSASVIEVNSQFGEEDIRHVPWDSILEVRAIDVVDEGFTAELETPFFQSKKAIGMIPSVHVFDNCIRTSQIPPVVVRAVHLPITISWDSTKYDNICLVRSYVSTHRFPSVVDNWLDDPYLEDETQCMRGASSFTTNLPYLPQFQPGWGLMAKIVDIKGGGRDTVRGIQIYSAGWDRPFTPCEHVWITDVNELEQKQTGRLLVYPNPATDVLYVAGADLQLHDCHIYDMQGRLHQHGKLLSEIDVSHLASGMYFLVLQSPTGEKWHQKFYKH